MLEGRFSEYTYKVLEKAGWFPGRHAFSTLLLPDGYDLYEPTRLVLDEFGSLSLNFFYSTTYGKNFHRRDQKANIEIDPSLCADEIAGGSTPEFSQMIQHPLYPLAVYYDDSWDPDSSNILIDDLGRIFLKAFWTDTFVGETFDIALNNLLAGGKGEIIDQNGRW
jgi:SUKH-3 immunity protein